MKGFKYQITVNVFLKKDKQNRDIVFAPVYLNSATKTVINFKYDVNKSFQEVLCRIDNLINEASGWVIKSADAEYVNISIFSLLSGSTYTELHCELKTQ